MRNVKVSVIVPIYKAEKYIERCVRSLMEQTLKDGIEFVFVNDCTPDKSMVILKRVITDYPERIGQIIIENNPQNLGVTQSRKKGVDLSSGEYIGWCDSDDWCEKDMFEIMYNQALTNSSDIVVCNYWDHVQGFKRKVCMMYSESPHEAIVNSIYGRSFSGTLWNQLIRKKLVKDCFECIVPVNYGEDTFTLLHIYYYASTMRVLDKPLYNHDFDNLESLVHVRDNTIVAWTKQQENFKRVEHLYYRDNGRKKFHVALSRFIFESKILYRGAFDSEKDFFYTFRQSSRDILRFYDWKKLSTWKMYFVHNCYFLYRIVCKKSRL